jgi:hypothetical protein
MAGVARAALEPGRLPTPFTPFQGLPRMVSVRLCYNPDFDLYN